MDSEKFEIRVLLRFFWKKRLTARAAAKEICDVEGHGTVSTRTAQRWFKRFEQGRTDLEDSARSGRPLEVDSEALRAAVEANPGTSTRRLSDEHGVSHMTVARHLHDNKISCNKTMLDLTPATRQCSTSHRAYNAGKNRGAGGHRALTSSSL
jgi:transposase